MSKALTLRIRDDDAAEIQRIAQTEGRSSGEIGARIVAEWLRQNRFPYIEFRTISGERVACIKGWLEVWQVVKVARHYPGANQVAATARHLDLLPEEVRAALDYASASPDEISAALAESDEGFERLKRLLPQIERTTLTDEDLARVALDGDPPGEDSGASASPSR